MRLSLALSLLAMLGLAAPAVSAPPAGSQSPPISAEVYSGVKVKVQGSFVNLHVNTSLDQPGHALQSFIAVLKKYPHARRIRASWSLMLGMNEIVTTVVYDRSRRTLVLFSRGTGDLGESCDYRRFTQVREPMFVQIANAHRDDSQEISWGEFDDLTHFGCSVHDLGSWHKPPPD